MSVSEADGGDPAPPVGLHRRQQVTRTHAGILGSIRGKCCADRKPIGGQGQKADGRHRCGQDLLGDCLDRATDNREQSPVVDVGADQQIHIGGGPSADQSQRTLRNEVRIDDGLPQQRAAAPQRSGLGCPRRSAFS